MKRLIYSFIFFFFLIIWPIDTIYASCQISPGRPEQVNLNFTGGSDGSTMTVNGKSFTRAAPQCTNPVSSGAYTVSCDTKSETLAADSLFAPLCGSSEERGKTNSTCWNCGSTVKCDGLDYAIGSTDPFISQIHNPVSPGDTNTDQVWRIPNASIPNTFTFNGMTYSKPSGDLIVCGANNLACGSSEECSNIQYPKINNRGSSQNLQCQTITGRNTPVASDTDIVLSARGQPRDVSNIEQKNLIDNTGDNDLGRAPQLSTLFGNTTVTNPDIQGLYQVNLNDGRTPIPKDEQSNWGVTLIELGTNGAIYSPKSGYDIGGGYNYTVLYASANELTLKGTLEDNAVSGYTLHFAGLNVDPGILTAYAENEKNGRTKLVAIPCGYQIGTPENSKFKVAVADTGTFMDPRVKKDWWHEPTNDSCAAIGPGLVDPLPTQICTATESQNGAPDVTTKVSIPNLASFGVTGKDKEGNSFLAGLLDSFQRPIKGILGFQGSKAGKPKLDEPSVYKNLGTTLDRALPYFTPLGINVQPIVQEYVHTETSTLCFDSDNENKQAFPIKERVIIPAPGLNKLRQNGRMLAGFTAPNVSISKNEYEHLGQRYPNILGSIQLKPTCDEPPNAREVRKVVVPTTEAEYYDLGQQNKLPIYYLKNWINTLRSVIGLKCSETDCNADVNPQMSARLKIKTPWIKEIMRDTTNDQEGKPVGALARFVPGAFYLRNDHGKVTGQVVEQEVGSNAEDIKNVDVNYFGAKTIDIYDQFTNCARYPQSLQKNLGYSCNFSDNDVTADRKLYGGADPSFNPSELGAASAIISGATNTKIPACILEAVKYIETGTQNNFSGAACDINECSAAGPFQVTTGAAPAAGGGWDTHCTKCGPNWTDGSRTCPDGWPGNWPQTPSDPNPCDDFSVAANRAVQMLQEKATIRCETLDNRPPNQQREAIITAANSYYGSSEPISRLGGCAYGEFVYKHCDGSYVCGTNNVDLGKKYEDCQKQRGL